jgi:hypothetical protein
MWHIIHWICGQHSPKTNAFQSCDQKLRQITRLYRWSKYCLKFHRLGIQLHVPKYLCVVHTRLAFFLFVNSTAICVFFLGPVTAFGSPSSHCVMDFKFRVRFIFRFLFSRTVQADTGIHSDFFQWKTGVQRQGSKVRNLRMSGTIPFLSLYAFTGWTGNYLIF